MSKSLNRALREMLFPGAGLIVPGVGNALAARVVESAGYKAFMVSGAAVANSYLGVPDIGLVSLNELANNVAAVRDVVDLPMLVDGDTGFGNAMNIRHTVRVLERAGANAIQLEDQTFPKRCGHFENKELVSKDEMVQKIKAAVDTRQDDNMMILARTDARAVEGLGAALDRANAYREAGADFLFVEAPLSLEELAAIPKQLPAIHMCNMVIGGKTPLLTRAQLAEMGYALIVYANAALQASLKGMQDVLVHLEQHGSIEGVESQLMMFSERQKMLKGDEFSMLANKYGTRPAIV